jgi:hypothetical protein
MPNEPKDWKEPSNCPKCGCGWTLLIKPGDIKVVFCSNPKCSFAWKAENKTLWGAVQCWNKICESYAGADRPKTPVLIEIYKSGISKLFGAKKVVDVPTKP